MEAATRSLDVLIGIASRSIAQLARKIEAEARNDRAAGRGTLVLSENERAENCSL